MSATPRLLVVCLASVAVGCGASVHPNVSAAPPARPALQVTTFTGVNLPTARLALDATGTAIAEAERDFAEGQNNLKDGHVAAARQCFDAAIDVLMNLPDGARRDTRAAAEFDQLLDRISALDLQSIRERDAVAETQSEPAAIDELLNAATVDRPQPALTTEETVAADLARTPHDLAIPVNDRVLSFVELFQGHLHDFMQAGLDRGLRYLPMIQEEFKSDGLPLDLSYVPLVESAFKSTALSRANARGMWQFMSETASEHGLERTWFIDERADPEKATHAAASYLKSLCDFFDGDWNLALASYNAGPGRIQKAIQRAHTSDYWSLTATSRYLPRETREYVPMIMAAIVIAKNPAMYGFDANVVDPLAYERVTVPDALDLKTIADWIGVSLDDLHELNPELRRTTTPAGEHELKVPIGTAATVQAKLDTADPLYAHFTFHTVGKGETVASIARNFRVSQGQLRTANDLSVRARVRVNDTLMIPQRTAESLPASPVAGAVRTAATPPTTRATGHLTYRVQPGDTLFSIAKHFSTTVDLIKRLNGLHSNKIGVGDRLTVRQ